VYCLPFRPSEEKSGTSRVFAYQQLQLLNRAAAQTARMEALQAVLRELLDALPDEPEHEGDCAWRMSKGDEKCDCGAVKESYKAARSKALELLASQSKAAPEVEK
jgi:hypothetical protein